MSDKKKILIVEDENIVAIDIKNTMEEYGYEVIKTLSKGEDAVELIKTNKPDLILMDIFLDGDLNGIETGVIISEKYNIPIIYITALAKETLLRSKITESSPFLVKPFSEEELTKTVENVLKN